ncbi:MAG TPA: phenylalanine--tRNA ligase subunit beta, partial [Candidatus Binataceae bacterium]|nr:phenylalanine--tRNA ligase subunit beta [Candidatus Binataceae bacterium]
APDLCPRYAGLEMGGLKIGPSPIRIRRRLELCGMRALNNVVDVTNYVMLEIGQPLHAFDIEKLAGRKIIVRRAGEDRDFETLDGLRRELRPDDLVIADGERAVAIAGVMGGLNSEISDSSHSLLLESAYFEPITVARTARRLGLRSEAGYRFERGIDRAGQAIALMRAAELLSQNAGAHVKGTIADVEPRPAAKCEISLDLKSMASLLGVEVPKAEVKRRLVALGATVKPAAKNAFTVTPPPHRPDLNQPADLAEEVARLTGLDDIPATLPSRDFAYSAPNQMREFFRVTREVMLGAGLTEADTIAFVPPEENRRLPGLGGNPVRIENPLSEELGEMRLSLLPGLVAALRFNLNRQSAAFHAFEIAKAYAAREGTPAEPYRLGMISYGDYAISEIGKPAIKAGFFTLKGVVETYLESLQLGGRIEFRPPRDIAAGFLHPGRSAQVAIGDEIIGYLGELHPRQAMEREFVEPCALAELDLEKLISYGFTPRTRVEPPPRFPAIRRDLALVLDREFPVAMVVNTILEIAPPLLEGAELFDVFEGGNLAPGKKSIALAIRYRAKDRTLTDEEVNRVHAGLVEQARTRLGAELRQ